MTENELITKCWACNRELEPAQKKCHTCGEWQGRSQRIRSYATRITIIVSLVGFFTGVMGFVYTTREELHRTQARDMEWLIISGKGISFGKDKNKNPVSQNLNFRLSSGGIGPAQLDPALICKNEQNNVFRFSLPRQFRIVISETYNDESRFFQFSNGLNPDLREVYLKCTGKYRDQYNVEREFEIEVNKP